MFKFIRQRKWSFNRDTAFGAAFILPALVVSIYIAEGMPPDGVFWLCCGVCLVCLVGSKHWWAPVGATALYAIGPLLGLAIFQQHRGAAIGVAVCAGVIGFVWWVAELPNRRARQAFADARHCPMCNRSLRAPGLHHPIIDAQESERHWLYRCSCGECTLFDLEGNAKPVMMPPRPPSDSSA
jgi:hypothetical protein